MTDAEQAILDDLYARLLVAEVERDCALTQLHSETERVLFLERRLEEMRRALD